MRGLGIYIAAIVLLPLSVFGQQLDKIGKKDGIKISGGINLNQNLYFSNGVEDRFNPYSYVLSGNVTVNAYGLSFPVSFTYSNQELSYTQPFNIVGLSPTYKNWTFHGGYRNLTFSKYTLAGHNFFGGGAEYKPGKWSFSAMGGRLLRPVEYDSSNAVNPVFQRMGYGLKAGYADGGDEISLISFYSVDDPNSIAAFPDGLGVDPMENHVYSISVKKKLNKFVKVKFEGARSGVTMDLNSNESSNEASVDQTVYLLSNSQSTVYSNAFNAGVDIAAGKTTLGAQLERVDPEYRTFGAYYFNTDFQNVTLNASRKFWKEKLNLSGRLGLQRDDLDGEKMSSMRRIVAMINGNMTVSKKLSLNASFSNFNSFVNVKPIDQAFVQNSQYDQLDTFNFVQTNQSINGGVNYTPLDNDNVMHSTGLSANYNTTLNDDGGPSVGTSVLGANIRYNVNWKKTGFSVGVTGNGNRNEFSSGEAMFIGAGINTGGAVWQKKLRISFSTRWSNNYESSELVGVLYSLSNNYSLKIGKHQSAGLNLRYTGRKDLSESEYSFYTGTFNEFMGSLNYSYNF